MLTLWRPGPPLAYAGLRCLVWSALIPPREAWTSVSEGAASSWASSALQERALLCQDAPESRWGWQVGVWVELGTDREETGPRADAGLRLPATSARK